MIRSFPYRKRAKSGIVRRGRAIAGKLSQVRPVAIDAKPVSSLPWMCQISTIINILSWSSFDELAFVVEWNYPMSSRSSSSRGGRRCLESRDIAIGNYGNEMEQMPILNLFFFFFFLFSSYDKQEANWASCLHCSVFIMGYLISSSQVQSREDTEIYTFNMLNSQHRFNFHC